ncbi:uncharacterized protein LOC142151115 isoform X2 [Mixophyes fleayi]|uniref:uncharacterized protein LOC142151115 isoform X2 n=1 Tax=Mixophyes fleayi TaxID=3061075 RepID=UPI003F4E15CC
MSCVLVVYLLLLWGQVCDSTGRYCVDQPNIAESLIGESITFSCSYVYPESEDSISSVTISVKAAGDHYCGQGDTEIYNSDSNSSARGYEGRLSAMLDRNTRSALITIKNLRSMDNSRYCCRVNIERKNRSPERWQSPTGTNIKVKGENDVILDQPHFITALAGDTVTVLSRFKTKNSNIYHNVTACHVCWNMDYNECGRNKYTINCTQRIGENVVFFQISQVNSSHEGQYYYVIDLSTEDGSVSSYRGIGTELLVTPDKNTLNISQPLEVVFKNATIVNCNFSVEDNRDILWTGVYWMTGNPREHFVYHPDSDYIHPDYKGKTRLVGKSNLLLEEFRGPDNTTFYCRVAIRRCLHDTNNPNRIETILEEGSGTRLRFQEISSQRQNNQNLIIALCVGCIILIIIILMVVYMKRRTADKKTRTPEETVVETIYFSEYSNTGYENPQVVKAQEMGDNLVYSTVHHQQSSTPAKPQKRPAPDTETVYADVKKH